MKMKILQTNWMAMNHNKIINLEKQQGSTFTTKSKDTRAVNVKITRLIPTLAE